MVSNKMLFALVVCGLMMVAMAAEAPTSGQEDQKAEGSFLHAGYAYPGFHGGYGLGYGGYGLGYGGYGLGYGLGYGGFYGRR